MDLIREILLKVEADPSFDGTQSKPISAAQLGIIGHTDKEVLYHVEQLIAAEYLAGKVMKTAHMSIVMVSKLTWGGHELLDAIRDPDVWDKTKARAKAVASVGVGFLWEIAKAEVKAKLGLSA
jgi:hypothetical protein